MADTRCTGSPRTRTVGAVGYVRVSTEDQASSGLGLKAQEKAIRDECYRRGLALVALLRDEGLSGKSLDRPALTEALALVEAGKNRGETGHGGITREVRRVTSVRNSRPDGLKKKPRF